MAEAPGHAGPLPAITTNRDTDTAHEPRFTGSVAPPTMAPRHPLEPGFPGSVPPPATAADPYPDHPHQPPSVQGGQPEPTQQPVGPPYSPVVLTVDVNIAQNNEISEDAEPLLGEFNRCRVMAVFDGLGGAGAKTYPFSDGTRRTGAFLASRRARKTVMGWIDERYRIEDEIVGGEPIAGQLEERLRADLAYYGSRLPDEGSRIRGTLHRPLPTTMVLVVAVPESHIAWICWAGDSRAFLLDPLLGLRQLTTDDLKSGGDALDNLMADSPMSNCLSADGRFSLRERFVRVTDHQVILVATDGCFGYVPSPAHFEYLLLESIRWAEYPPRWRDSLADEIKRFPGDDATLAGTAFGWRDTRAMAEDFEPRRRYMYENYIQPVDAAMQRIRDLDEQRRAAASHHDALRGRLWQEYRQGYEWPVTEPSEGAP